MNHLHEFVDMNKSLSEMTDDEKLRYEHQKMHDKHKGHEQMHVEMLLILVITLIVAQFCLVYWKKRHYKSYLLISLIGLWIVPLGFSIKNGYGRFIIFWIIFSLITGVVMRKAYQKPIQGNTPRLVYKWFLFIYKLSYGLGIVGYVIMMMTFFGINLIFNQPPNVWMDVALLFVFYGLYYGVLGRDLSELCTDKMACHIGYYTIDGIPTKNLPKDLCAICANKLFVSASEEGILESTYKLSCDHTFHEFCIRGWLIVGKKQTCPYCKEKVDLKKMFNPWQKPHLLFGTLLDWIRYLIAWQPAILFIVQGINWFLGLE
ncbi:unnamed protein product [Diamesa serratosioi]